MAGPLTTEAVVLRSMRYGEADRILHVYTPMRGRVGAIAKGVRRSRSRFGGRLEPFFRLKLGLHEGRSDLLTVTSAETVAGHPRLREDADALDAAARACDAVSRLFESPEPHPEVFNLLCTMLDAARRGPAGGRRARAPPGLPAQAAAGRGLHAAPVRLRPVRGGGGPRRLLAGRGRRGLRRRARPGPFPLDQAAHTFLAEALGRPLAAGARRRRARRCGSPTASCSRRPPTTRTCGCAPPHRIAAWTRTATPDPSPWPMPSGAARSRRRRSLPGRRARGRRSARAPEEDCGLRSPLQRDRDRIVHCKAFRRLKHKTQVFVAPEGDHYRTRLTHTLEVTQIARTVARALRLNEDLTEAIGLGHDLGHPPFGHIGEGVLDALRARALRPRASATTSTRCASSTCSSAAARA